MPNTAAVGRTRTVETKTVEEIPVHEPEVLTLGMSCLEFLEAISADELDTATVKVYRVEPKSSEGFLCKLQPAERIDEQWIQSRYGGGVFSINVKTKAGKSGFDRAIRVFGEPKYTARELGNGAVNPTPPGAPAATDVATIGKLTELLESLINRIANSQPAVRDEASAQTTGAIVGLMSDAAREAIKTVGLNQRGPSESEIDQELKRAMIKRFLEPPAASSFDTDLQRLKLLKEIVGPAGQSRSLLEELRGLTEVRELLGWGSAAGGGAHRNAYDIASEVIDKAPMILDKWGEISQHRVEVERERRSTAEVIARARASAPGPGARPGLQTSANPPAPPNLQAPPGAGLRLVPQDRDTITVDGPTPEPAGDLDTESPVFVAFVKRRIVEMLESGAEGEAIVDFLDGVRQEKFVEMLAQYSAEQITAFLRNDPVLAKAVANPRWPEVLQQAKQYLGESGADPAKKTRIN